MVSNAELVHSERCPLIRRAQRYDVDLRIADRQSDAKC
jgi:hypothetical protein